ncbi:MAG: RagB/SusD family nutrient uptake outer membrane protein [Chitinophagaceae bacterium]|nr:RagB/SusD family nutrient uptake outer membrane protein [Chitinophagaceae bacterium]
MNMKKIFLILAIGSLALSSCKKDYLETKPTNAVSDGVVFTNTTDAWKAIEGMHRFLYRQMYGTQALGGISGNMIYMDALGEDLVMTGQSNGWFIGEYRWINHRLVTSTICYYNYLYFFSFISNANQILAQIDAATGPQADKDAIKGQALAYRGWAYFMMIQLYGERFDKNGTNDGLGLPMRTAPTVGATPRVSVAEVYTQINKDLSDAIALLGGSVAARRDQSHINVNVARGIKARVALAQQNWTEAAALAVQARTGFTLMTNAQYMGGFNNYTNPEWIWGFKQQEDQGTFFYSFFAYLSCNFNSTNIRTNPKAINSRLYNLISATDVRKGLWDPTGTNTAFPIPLNPNGSRFPYMNRKFFVNNVAVSAGDVPLMRAAEMYLIEAEALARAGGQEVAARQALFTLARQRDPNYVLSTNSGQALIDEIMVQRRVELWGEGFRFYDLKRTNSPLDRTGANHNASLAGIFSMPAGDKQWQFLIPQQELNNTNGVVVQNPL